MTTPEETIARALCEHDGRDPERLEPGDDPYMDNSSIEDGRNRNGEICHFYWRRYVLKARAILSLPEIIEALKHTATCPHLRCAESGWRDIESAPKDGTPILAFRNVVRWQPKAPTFMAVIAWMANKMHPQGSWSIADWNHGGYDYGPSWTFHDPTHWMPLPDAPTPSGHTPDCQWHCDQFEHECNCPARFKEPTT